MVNRFNGYSLRVCSLYDRRIFLQKTTTTMIPQQYFRHIIVVIAAAGIKFLFGKIPQFSLTVLALFVRSQVTTIFRLLIQFVRERETVKFTLFIDCAFACTFNRIRAIEGKLIGAERAGRR